MIIYIKSTAQVGSLLASPTYVVCRDERVVDGDDLDGRVSDGRAQDEAADAAEAVDADLDRRGGGEGVSEGHRASCLTTS